MPIVILKYWDSSDCLQSIHSGYLSFVLSFSFFILNRYLKHQSAIQRAFVYLKLPIIRGLYREYVSAFALEWGSCLHKD